MSFSPLNSKNSISKKINSSANSLNSKKELKNSPMVTVDKLIKKNEESEEPLPKLPDITSVPLRAVTSHTDQKEA